MDEQNKNESTLQECLQSMIERERILNTALENAKEELVTRQEELANLESSLRLREEEAQILQQSLRTEHEKHVHAVRKCEELEKHRIFLVHELCKLNFDLEETLLKVQNVKARRETLEIQCRLHVKKVKDLEGDSDSNPELISLKTDVAFLQGKKRKLDENDILAKLIASGEAIETVEAQKRAIQISISENWVEIEGMEEERKQMAETSASLQKQLVEDEKQQQAELEQLRGELAELESEEEKLVLESERNEYFKPANDNCEDQMDSEYSDTDMDMLLAEAELQEEQM